MIYRLSLLALCCIGGVLQAQEKDDAATVTKQQVRDELVSLLAAGHETTTNTLAWTFYLLSEHPAVLEKVLTELQAVLGGRDPQVDDLPKLTYFDWVIKESMRLYPSAWTQGRQAVEGTKRGACSYRWSRGWL